MTVFLFILSCISLVGLLLVSSVAPRRSRYSAFELERRCKNADAAALLDSRREAMYGDIVSVLRVLQAVLLVGFVLCVVGVFGWVVGGLLAVVISLEYGMVASRQVVRRVGMSLYSKYEMWIMEQLIKHRAVVRWLRASLVPPDKRRIDSREELQQLVSDSEGVLRSDEKKLILASLVFDERPVNDVMTPKSVVETIKQAEVLGPLVLDDLHKTGHSRFPVIGEDIDHIVGILYVHDVLTLDTSKNHSSKVESAMSKQVYYIREDHTLAQALSAFLSTHHHLFIVINEFRETVGILTLEDTLEALLGRKIVDEFDAHDDMRAVATRNATKKTAPNRPAGSKDF